MKKSFHFIIISMMLFSCVPVIRQEFIDQAMKDVPLSEIRKTPDLYRGKLFIVGGIIVQTKITEKGSLIEGVHVPVDSRGHLRDLELSEGRFLAIYPEDKGLLDPLIYKKGRKITLAGRLIETRMDKIDDLMYTYPLFEIKDIYLWEEMRFYYDEPFYPPWYYPPWYYSPWYYPYPYLYRYR